MKPIHAMPDVRQSEPSPTSIAEEKSCHFSDINLFKLKIVPNNVDCLFLSSP